MKLRLLEMENKVVMGLVLIAGFIMVVSAASVYIQSEIYSGAVCGCAFPIELLVPMMASGGFILGSLVYYFISGHEKKDLSPILGLLDYDQRVVIEKLAKSGGSMKQARLVSAIGLNKVKVSRVISSLEAKDVIEKRRSGVTNIIELKPALKKVLC